MKKFFIYLFLTCSMFIVVSCFYRKANNKHPLSFQVVLNELKDAKIGFDIQNDINQLSLSMKELNTNTSYGNDLINGIVKMGKTFYYGVRFFIQIVFHSLIATLNVVICCLRVIGFTDISYINSASIFGSEIPIKYPFGKGGTGLPDFPFTD